MIVLALAASLLLALTSVGGTTRSGLFGVVTRGPLTPVCKVGTPCDGPAGHSRLTLLRGGRAVASVLTARNGAYRIFLAPGRYSVRTSVGIGHVPRPPAVTVPRGRLARANFFADTGIR